MGCKWRHSPGCSPDPPLASPLPAAWAIWSMIGSYCRSSRYRLYWSHDQARDQSVVERLISQSCQAYENKIRKIDNDPQNRRQVASQALMWVSHARRPLQVDKLCHALAMKLGDTVLDQDSLLSPRSTIESCSGLIVLDADSSTFRLVHYTL